MHPWAQISGLSLSRVWLLTALSVLVTAGLGACTAPSVDKNAGTGTATAIDDAGGGEDDDDTGTDTDAGNDDEEDDDGGETEPVEPIPIFLTNMELFDQAKDGMTTVQTGTVGTGGPQFGEPTTLAEWLEAMGRGLVSFWLNGGANVAVARVIQWSGAFSDATNAIFLEGGRLDGVTVNGSASGVWYTFKKPVPLGSGSTIDALRIKILPEKKDGLKQYAFEYWCKASTTRLTRCARLIASGKDAATVKATYELDVKSELGTLVVEGSYDIEAGWVYGDYSDHNSFDGTPIRNAFHMRFDDDTRQTAHLLTAWSQFEAEPWVVMPEWNFSSAEVEKGDISVHRYGIIKGVSGFARQSAFIEKEKREDADPLTDAIFGPFSYDTDVKNVMLMTARSTKWHPDCATYGARVKAEFVLPAPSYLGDFPDDICAANTDLSDALLFAAIKYACGPEDAELPYTLTAKTPNLGLPITGDFCVVLNDIMPVVANPQIFVKNGDGKTVQCVAPLVCPAAMDDVVAMLTVKETLPVQWPKEFVPLPDDAPTSLKKDIVKPVELP